jgi:D-3-phosphoglycerate dehydrogenase
VRGKTLGIVGYGHVGSQLGIMAEALSLRVIFYDSVALMPIGRASPCASLHELLQSSDFVSINVSTMPENKHMIGKKELALMKPKSYLINTSFGDAVDPEALAEAIKSGHLAGAALDSFPMKSELDAQATGKFVSPLQNLPNVILTPHYGISH